MANKISKTTDLASGFFSDSTNSAGETSSKITAPVVSVKKEAPKPKETVQKKETEDVLESTIQEKNLGGRPTKTSQKKLKNVQYSLTMHPELYEKLRILSDERTRGNFSALIDYAIRAYCKDEGINLDSIEVPKERMDFYWNKQNKTKK